MCEIFADKCTPSFFGARVAESPGEAATREISADQCTPSFSEPSVAEPQSTTDRLDYKS